MTSKLSAILAVEKDIKKRNGIAITDYYQLIQKSPLLSGISRTYRPKDEDGDQFPPEQTKVQVKVQDVLSNVTDHIARLWDVEATKDYGNTLAKGNIVVNGETIAEQVPVTYLLFLEKELVDVQTIISKIPVLDQADEWEYDSTADCFRSKTVETAKTKKIPRNHVLAEATDKHPAQVQLFHEDVVQGYWSVTKFSGALPAAEKTKLIDRVNALRDAVKTAREEANSINVSDQNVGREIVDFILG